MNIQQQINKLQTKLDELKAQASKCEEPEIDWSKMIGRLVEVRNCIDKDWLRPRMLECYATGFDKPFTADGFYEEAKLYQGPTRPNWIEWSGGECPVDGCAVVLFEMRSGETDLCAIPSTIRWSHVDANGDIMRYTIIEP